MKKLAVALVATLLMVTGCNKDQIVAIANGVGLGTAVTWIAYDNPQPEVKAQVSTSLDLVKSCITNIQTGQTYMQVYLPIIQKAVTTDTNIPPQYKPAILAGSIATLTGLDLLFASHPDWKKDRETAQEAALAFITGAQLGLKLPESDPTIQAAKSGHRERIRMQIQMMSRMPPPSPRSHPPVPHALPPPAVKPPEKK